MADTLQFHNSATLTKEERLRRKAESTDPIPIRLTNNYAFHRVFKKPEVCKGFLMALLHLKETDIRSVDVADPIKEGESPGNKEGILDIKVHLNSDRKINIEMQASYQADWSERSIFYLCRIYVEDLTRGEEYRDLDMCIHVGILDFSLLTSPGFHHHIQLLDNQTGELYSDKFQIHVLELSKLNDPFPEEDQELYYWAKMIAAENLEVMQMQVHDNPYRQAVFDEAKYASLNPMQRYVYLREFMTAMDYNSQVSWNREQGLAEGLVKGRSEGLASGLAKGDLGRLFSQIQKKIQKGKTLSETASELEDTEEHLLPLYKAVQQHPDLTAEQLADLFLKEQT